MNATKKNGIILIFSLFASVQVVFPSHIIKPPLPQPAMHGNSGITLETGLSNDPWSYDQGARWNLYGNYCLELYGLEFPFSFSISRDLQNFSHPFARFGVSPSFGWAKIYAGISRMQLAGISSQGVEFNGAGLELTPGKLRFAGFYGYMAAENDFSSNGYGSGRTKYSVKAFGAKIGIGDEEKHIGLSVFSREAEKDQAGSAESGRQGEKQSAAMDFGFRFRKGIDFSGGANIIRTLKENIGWGMESSLGFSAMKGRMNAGVNFFHKSEDEITETMGGFNAMLMLERGLLGGSLNFSRMVYHDPGYGISYRSAAANGSLMYSNFGAKVPLNLSLSAAWNRFSQEYGKSSSLGLTLTGGTNLLKSHALNLSASAGYEFFTADQTSKREIMLSCNVGYQAGNNLFSSYLNYNNIPGDEVYLIHESAFRKQNTYRMIAGISWSRSF